MGFSGFYDMILGQYLLTELGLNLKFSNHVIQEYGGLLKGSTAPMVDLGTYEFKYLNTREITPEYSFANDFFEEVSGSEHFRTATKRFHVIVDNKFEKEYLHKVMETQCRHLTMAQRNKLLKSLQKFE